MKIFEQLNQINDELENVHVTEIQASNPAEIMTTMKSLAPVLIAVLGFVMIFTGERADRKIRAVITYLNLIKLI